jgi:two-component system phosphate regulon sensor histidine kinase PhoR
MVMMNCTNHEYVTIRIVDTGVGILAKDLPFIFDRFYRGEARNAKGKLIDPRGLGQGLYIAKTVAEAHNGQLNVQSTPAEGSTFTMVLPLAS